MIQESLPQILESRCQANQSKCSQEETQQVSNEIVLEIVLEIYWRLNPFSIELLTAIKKGLNLQYISNTISSSTLVFCMLFILTLLVVTSVWITVMKLFSSNWGPYEVDEVWPAPLQSGTNFASQSYGLLAAIQYTNYSISYVENNQLYIDGVQTYLSYNLYYSLRSFDMLT
jgi:hypothetical protein